MFRANKYGFVASLIFASIPTVALAGGSIPDIRQNNWAHPVVYQPNEACTQFRQYDGHVGNDLCRPFGTSVVAIADGCVEDYKVDASNYGGIGVAGGVVLLRHATNTGRPFYAVYGHDIPKTAYLDERKCSDGTKSVRKGDEIATILTYVGGTDHLHFGIHPDTVATKKYQGADCYEADYCGWVEPFQFLMNNHPAESNGSNCNPWMERCTIMSYETIGWFPPVNDCRQATQWFILHEGSDGKYPVGSSTIASCSLIPAACYQ